MSNRDSDAIDQREKGVLEEINRLARPSMPHTVQNILWAAGLLQGGDCRRQRHDPAVRRAPPRRGHKQGAEGERKGGNGKIAQQLPEPEVLLAGKNGN